MTRRAIVVHPDPSVGARLRDACEASGFTTTHVRDGERAIDRFVQEPAEVVVIDVVLPGRDGAAAIESMRWAPGGDEIVVLLSGTTSSPARLASVAREVGATATLPGPEPTLGPLLGVLAGLRSKPAPSPRKAELGATLPAGGRPLPAAAGSPDWSHDSLTLPGNRDLAETPARGTRLPERAPSGGAIAPRMSGRLEATAFPRLLTRLAEQRAAGVLHVSSSEGTALTTTGGPVQKRVFFRAGVPVHVESNRADETLGALLRRAHLVDAEAVERALDRASQGEGRIGGILVAMGALSPQALRDALEQQQRERIFDLFQWPEGSFHFVDEAGTPPDAVALELSLVELLWSGVVERLPGPQALRSLAPHEDRFVVPDARRMRPFLDRELPDFARRMLGALDGSAPLSTLLNTGPSRRAFVAKLLYALESVGAITFRDSPGLPEEMQAVGPSAGAVAGFGERLAELDRLEALLGANRLTEALEVSGEDEQEIEEAAENLDARLRPLAESNDVPRPLRTRAYATLANIARARRKLLDEVPYDAFSGDDDGPNDAFSGDDDESTTGRRMPTDRPTVGGTPLHARSADAGRRPAAAQAEAAAGPSPRRAPGSEAPTDAEGVPTYLGEVLRLANPPELPPATFDDITADAPSFGDITRGAPAFEDVTLTEPAFEDRTAAAPSFDDATITDPRFDDETAEGDPRLELASATAQGSPSDRQTRAIELPDDARPAPDDAHTEPGGVPASEPEPTSAGPETENVPRTEEESPAPDDEPAAASPTAAPGPGTLDAAELDLQVERMLRAERAFRKGRRALAKERVDEAIELFESAEALCPEEGEFLAALGDALWRRDHDSARARALLEKSAELAPQLAGPHLSLGALFEHAGEFTRARVAYERALAANPGEEAALAGLKRLID